MRYSPLAIAVGLSTLLWLGIVWEIAVWVECRASHTLLYCLEKGL